MTSVAERVQRTLRSPSPTSLSWLPSSGHNVPGALENVGFAHDSDRTIVTVCLMAMFALGCPDRKGQNEGSVRDTRQQRSRTEAFLSLPSQPLHPLLPLCTWVEACEQRAQFMNGDHAQCGTQSRSAACRSRCRALGSFSSLTSA